MSFILDALKKSEIERQRQTIPGLMDSGPAAARAISAMGDGARRAARPSICVRPRLVGA